MRARPNEKIRDLATASPLIAWYGWNAGKGAPVLVRQIQGLAAGGMNPLAAARAAALLASTVFCGLLVVLLLARLPPRSSSSGWSARAAAVLGTFATVGFQSLAFARLTMPWAIASAVLIFSGFALSLGVVAWLGRSFSVVPEARRLVTSGPYALCRHPLYVVEQLAILGVALQYAQPWSGLLLAAQSALQLVRAHYEEKILRGAFPGEYAAYAARTARFIPGVY